MSGQGPLLRIGVTCAAIVIGSAIIGSQLSTSRTLPQVISTVADEEDAGMPEDESYGSSGDEVVDEGMVDDAELDTEAAEDLTDEDDEEESEDLAEAADDESREGTFVSDGEPVSENETSDPAKAGSPEEEPAEDDEGGFTVIRPER